MGIICCAIVIVRVAGEGVSAIGGARFMDKYDIVIAKCKNVAGDMAVNVLGCPVVLQIFVVSDDCYAMSSAHKEVAPMFKASNDGEEFSVPDRIVSFGLGGGFQV